MNCLRYLRHLFDRTPPGDWFCSTEKYFINKILKSPVTKKKENGGKKNNDTLRKT